MGDPPVICACDEPSPNAGFADFCEKPTAPGSSTRSSITGTSPRSSSRVRPGSPRPPSRTSSRSCRHPGCCTPRSPRRSGRRAIEVTLARQLGLVAGLHFSARHLRVAICDVGRTVVAENHVPLALEHRHDRELDRAALLLSDMVESVNASIGDMLAVGVALPGRRSRRATGMISTPGLLRGWEGVPIAEEFENRIERPVFVDNEANLGGLAELRSGAARGSRGAAYIRVGHSISAGLLIDGAIFRGVTGKAGQIGHVTIDENGPICHCGSRGCLDTLAGGPALLELFRDDPGMQRIRDLLLRGRGRRRERAARDRGRRPPHRHRRREPLQPLRSRAASSSAASSPRPARSCSRRCATRSSARRSPSADGVPEIVQGELGDRAELLGCLALAIENVGVDAEARAQNPATGRSRA